MHGATLMPGMLTPEEMAQLAAAKGVEFDRLFLEGMIKHHGGAITMVKELFATPGAGQEGGHLRVRVGRGSRSADGDRSHGRDAEGDREMRVSDDDRRVGLLAAAACAVGRLLGDRRSRAAAPIPTIRASA